MNPNAGGALPITVVTSGPVTAAAYPAYLIDAMLSEYQALYHESALERLSGVSFHVYAELWKAQGCVSDTCIAENWRTQVQTWINWIANKNSVAYPLPNQKKLEAWLTETGWSPCCEPDGATALRHMNLLCPYLTTMSLTRYAWFIGVYNTWGPQPSPINSLSLFDASAHLTPLGTRYATC